MCTVNKQRPKNLNLFTIRFPLPAIVSILHRISGVFLFLLIPFMLWGLSYSLASESDFQFLQDKLSSPWLKITIFLFAASFLYHFTAGIRHLLMDVNIGVELKSGRLTAVLTLIIAFLLIALVGIYLW